MQIETRIRKLEKGAGAAGIEALPLHLVFTDREERAAMEAIEGVNYPAHMAAVIRIRGVKPSDKGAHHG